MSIQNFNTRFPDEDSCIAFIKEQRVRQGVICKRCRSERHYWLGNKKVFQCSGCGFRTSLKSGTVMENSNLPIRVWLLAMTFITATKKNFSAAELQRQLGLKRYQPVFELYHKLRATMGRRDSMYRLEDMVEYDEAFVEKATGRKERRNLKRGRGSQRQVSVAVMAESTILEDLETGEKDKSCQYFKMRKITNLKSRTAENLIRDLIDGSAVLQTDESTTYSDLADCVEVHVKDISGSDGGKFNLKWAHIAI